ncbi:hypothetical protein UlMin_021307 [Ulmus minor]
MDDFDDIFESLAPRATLETNGTEEALKKQEDSFLGVADDITKAEKSFVGSIDCFQREGGAVNDNGDIFRKSLGEHVDIFSSLDCFDDFLTQTTSDTDVQHGNKFLTSMITHSEETFGTPAHGSIGSSSFLTCDIVHSQTCSYYHSTQDSITFSEAVGYEVFFDFETCEATIVFGQCFGKFQPKPRLIKEKKKPSTNIAQAESSLTRSKPLKVHVHKMVRIDSMDPVGRLHNLLSSCTTKY